MRDFSRMQMKAVSWIGMCAAAALSAAAAGEPWRVVAQPDLKEELERAPVLQTESLGAPARGVNV